MSTVWQIRESFSFYHPFPLAMHALQSGDVVPKLSLRVAGVLVRSLEVVDAASLARDQHARNLNVPVHFRKLALVRLLLHVGETPGIRDGSILAGKGVRSCDMALAGLARILVCESARP